MGNQASASRLFVFADYFVKGPLHFKKGGAAQKLLTNVESFLSVTAMESKIPRLQFCKNLGNS